MSTRRICYISIFVALITVGGLVSFSIPFTQVQISFQTVFVLAAGLLLGGRDGAIAVLVYLVMGLLGLPVFTQGGGPQYIFMPSFGYLIGFPLGALVAGGVCSRIKTQSGIKTLGACALGMLPVYVIGIGYQVFILVTYSGFAVEAALAGVPAVLVLAVKDGVLCALVSSIYPSLRRAIWTRRKAVKNKFNGKLLKTVSVK